MQTPIQLAQKAKQIEMNKEAAKKLLMGLHAQLARTQVSTITLMDSVRS